MSIDVSIFPKKSAPVTLNKINAFWGKNAPKQLITEYGNNLNVRTIKSATPISGNHDIQQDIGYTFDLKCSNTISLYKFDNSDIDDERSYLEDYVASFVGNFNEFVKLTTECDFHFSLESYSGRGKLEIFLLLILASAIAEIVDGYVLITDKVLDLESGLYRGDFVVNEVNIGLPH